MSQPTRGAQNVAPILIELARAVRAFQFFADGHATRAHALRKAASVWADTLTRVGELDLEITEHGFKLGGIDPVDGPALDELASALHFHGVMGLQIHPALQESELECLVEHLARDPRELAATGRLSGALQRSGVRHLAVWEIPHAAAAPLPPDDAPPPAPLTPETPEQDSALDYSAELATEEAVTLIKELTALDEAPDLGEYRLAANRVDGALTRLLTCKNHVDAYRAAILFCRHCADTEGREPAIRADAQDRLRTVLRDEHLLRYVIELSYEPDGTTSVQAIQILTYAAPQAVPRLLEEHAKEDADWRSATTAILLAMGEHAFPAIVEELSSLTPARARRAVRLLGDMQNPSGVEFLADQLDHPDSNLQREVAQSLARIGSTRAIKVLCDALFGDPALALIAAGGLGGSKHRAAVRALMATVNERSASDELRREAIRALGRIGDLEALPCLQSVLEKGGLMGRKKNRPLRVAAAQAIGKLGTEDALLVLQAHADSGDASVAKACTDILRHIEQG
jgi:HEAT repeat protein